MNYLYSGGESAKRIKKNNVCIRLSDNDIAILNKISEKHGSSKGVTISILLNNYYLNVYKKQVNTKLDIEKEINLSKVQEQEIRELSNINWF